MGWAFDTMFACQIGCLTRGWFIIKRELTNRGTERVQHAFRTSGLCPALIRLLQNPRFSEPNLLTYVYSLLEFSSSDDCRSITFPAVIIGLN